MPHRATRWELQLRFAQDIKFPKKGLRAFFELYRSHSEPEKGKSASFPHVLYRSEAVGSDFGYMFCEAIVPIERVLINGTDREVRMDILEYKKKGGHTLMASVDMNFRELLNLSTGAKIELVNRKGKSVGSAICVKSMQGEGSSGKVYSTTIEIQSIEKE